MIFGWGSDTVSKKLNEWTVAVCQYRYIHIFWVLSIVTNKKWFLQGRDRAHDAEVTREQLESMHGADCVPAPTFWRSWSLVALPGAFVALGMVMTVVSGVAGLFGFEGETVADAKPVAAVATTENLAGPSADEQSTTSLEQSSDDSDTDSGASALQSSEAADDSDLASEETPSTAGDIQDLSLASSIQQVSTHNSVSTNVSSPNQGSAVMSLDRVFTTPSYRDMVATAGRCFLLSNTT